MAGKVISRFQSGSGIHLISSTFYGTCNTAADVAVKQVEINDEHVTELKLIPGMLLSVKFTNGNTATNPQLKILDSNNNVLKDAILIAPDTLIWGAGNVLLFVYHKDDNNEQWISNYLSVSGGTLTGKLDIRDNNINITTVPSSNQYDRVFEVHDLNNKEIMNITAVHPTNNYHGFSIGVYDPDTGQQNTVQLTQNNNNGYAVWISQPAAWRSALGVGTIGTKDTLSASDIPSLDYLPLSGGTVTGNTTISASDLSFKQSNLTIGTTPSSNINGNARIYFKDSANATMGYVVPYTSSTGNQYTRINCTKGSNTNDLYLGVKSDGEKIVSLTAAPWRTALGIGAIGLKATLSSADIPDNAADTSGNAGTATKLKTARNLYVNLATAYDSSAPVTFDGSAAKALPVNGILPIANGGTGKATTTLVNYVFASPTASVTVATAPSWRKLVAADIPNLNTSKLTAGTLGIARGGTGSTAVTSIVNTSTVTIYVWGPVVMIQFHGVNKAPDGTAIWSTAYLANYKPEYNISTIVASPTGELARAWVNADDGKVYLSAVNTTSSKAWYGTLTYIYMPT